MVFRLLSRRRERWMMMSTAEAICWRIASKGSPAAPWSTIVSRRLSISAVELACPVDSEPSCPVFMACNISSASAPRTSPTTIRSGRIRSADLIRSLMLMAPLPSGPAFRVSRRTRFWIFLICSSAESSMVMIRSSLGIKFDKAFKKVVFPLPVPPLTKILYLALTSVSSTCATSSVSEPKAISF